MLDKVTSMKILSNEEITTAFPNSYSDKIEYINSWGIMLGDILGFYLGIADGGDDYCYIYLEYETHNLRFGSCVGGFIPLRKYLPEELNIHNEICFLYNYLLKFYMREDIPLNEEQAYHLYKHVANVYDDLITKYIDHAHFYKEWRENIRKAVSELDSYYEKYGFI